MRIIILMPPPAKKPIGGYKIIYHYFNNIILSNKDIKVQFHYLLSLPEKKNNYLRNFIKKIYYTIFQKKLGNWFNFDKNAGIKHYIGIKFSELVSCDVIVVSAVRTAIYLKELNISKPVLYFIQHIEDWSIKKEMVVNSFHFGFYNIVVSQWLKEQLNNYDAPVGLHLPNPVDEIFKVKKKIEERNNYSVIFMYHEAHWKGSKEAIKALKIVKEKYPKVKISCFSVFSKPMNFPSWIEYYVTPTRQFLVELLNNHFIFISSSYSEGYGLPPAEAMACGCCVITTDSGGIRDFAIDNETAVVVDSPPEPQQIAKKIIDIFTNPEKGYFLSKNGAKKIKEFNWDKNTQTLKKNIDQLIRNFSKNK